MEPGGTGILDEGSAGVHHSSIQLPGTSDIDSEENGSISANEDNT